MSLLLLIFYGVFMYFGVNKYGISMDAFVISTMITFGFYCLIKQMGSLTVYISNMEDKENE